MMDTDTEPQVTTPPDGKELLELNVKEVSLVGKPAIRRKFVVTKQDDTTPGEGTGQTSELVTQEVSKAALPLFTQLAEEKLAAVGGKVDQIVAALKAGTLTTEACWQYFDAIYSLLYKVESDVRSIAQVMAVPPLAPVMKSLEPNQRLVVEKVLELLKSTEEKMAEPTPQSPPAPAQPTAQEAITKAVTDAIGPAITSALKPFEDRLDKVEKALVPAQPASTTTPAVKAEEPKVDVAKAVEESVAKAIAPLVEQVTKANQRLDALEGQPAATGAETTETTTQKGEPKPGSSGFWGPSFAVLRS